MPVTVSQLAIAPVKAMRLQRRIQIQLGQQEVRGDRDGHLLKLERHRLLLIHPLLPRGHTRRSS